MLIQQRAGTAKRDKLAAVLAGQRVLEVADHWDGAGRCGANQAVFLLVEVKCRLKGSYPINCSQFFDNL